MVMLGGVNEKDGKDYLKRRDRHSSDVAPTLMEPKLRSEEEKTQSPARATTDNDRHQLPTEVLAPLVSPVVILSSRIVFPSDTGNHCSQ